MNRLLILAVCMVMSLAAMAKAPNLNVDKLFDGSYDTNKSVSMSISKGNGRYFRSFTVKNNAELVKTVDQLFKIDRKTAASTDDFINGGVKFLSFKIINNGKEIQVGLNYESNNGCYLFINGPIAAFE